MKIVSCKATITRKDLEGVLDCLINDELTTGNPVKAFESNISNLTGMKYALATSSLTAAYHLIFHVLDIKNDDEIIMPSFFNQAPMSALKLSGGKAVLVDNDDNSLFPSTSMIKEKITDRTKGIIIGHTMGFHFEMEGLLGTGIPIIEDISHAVGTEYDDAPAGSRGTYTVISFSPAMIMTTGNGGMVLTNNSKNFATMRELRGAGDDNLNLDYTMTDFQGAMGISQLLKLKAFIKRRRDIARLYYEALKLTHHQTPVHFNEHFAYQAFPVIFDAPGDKVEKYWKKNGIEIVHPVSRPLHGYLNFRGIEFPNSDRMSKKLYTLPLYPTLTKKDIEKISKTLSRFI